MRIIIVDDHVLFREGIASIFRAEPDFEIIGLAGSVEEAINLARNAKPEIILMDFTLTDGTGVDATRKILSEQPGCKIIFLTMSEEDEHLLAAIRAGAKGYLLKDMRPSKLAAALRSVYQGESAISRSMTLRLMEELTRTRPPEAADNNANLEALTAREMEVLRKIAVSKSNQDIASELYISENTVKYHVHSILGKLGLSDRKEAAQYARDNQV
jgi:two-component system, NarL family, response regulator LiaR